MSRKDREALERLAVAALTYLDHHDALGCPPGTVDAALEREAKEALRMLGLEQDGPMPQS